MHPEIRRFPSLEFYSNKLRDAQRITLEVEQFNSGTLDEEKKKRVVADFIRVDSRLHLNPVMFFDLASREETHGKSFRNQTECRFLFSFLSFIAPLLKGFTIGIVTPYKSQVDLIRREIHTRKSMDSSSSSSVTGEASARVWRELLIDVNTVDGYQGKEKDIIVLSTVRTRSIGFLVDQRRLNVAITRAKRCLVIIGCERLLSGDPVWNRMITYLRARKSVHHTSSDDFKSYAGYSDLKAGIYGQEQSGDGGREKETREKQRGTAIPIAGASASATSVSAPMSSLVSAPVQSERRETKNRERRAIEIEEGELIEKEKELKEVKKVQREKRRGEHAEASTAKKNKIG
jgi:hypothetical protein